MKKASKGVLIAVIVIVLGTIGYFSVSQVITQNNKKNESASNTLKQTSTAENTPEQTPIATTTRSASPSVTATPSATISGTPSVTAIPEYVQKEVIITTNAGDTQKYKLTVEIPSAMKVSSDVKNTYLVDGTKTFMWIYVPYEYYAKYTYSSITNVASDTLIGLRRFTSTTSMGNDFKVGYTTQIYTAANCAEDVAFEAVAAPCAAPISSYSSEVGFVALCSVNSKYTPICDKVMKNIKIQKI